MKKDYLLSLLKGTIKIRAQECQGHKLWLWPSNLL